METAILVVLAVVILVLLMVLLAVTRPSTQLRAVAVSDEAPPVADPLVPLSSGLGEHRRATDRPVEGYCVKDRTMVEMLNPVLVALRTGRLATVGVCPLCATEVYKIEKTPEVVRARAHVREERERIRHARRETA